MTTTEAIQKICTLACEQTGYHEGENNYNKYAEHPFMKKALGWDAQNQPWCAIFVVHLFFECFGLRTGKRMMHGCSALCRAQAAKYRRHGAYYTTPRIGDQIFFRSEGGINHTGVVIGVSDVTVTTVEGNSGDSVAERTYRLDDASIAGYGRPNWALVADDGEA